MIYRLNNKQRNENKTKKEERQNGPDFRVTRVTLSKNLLFKRNLKELGKPTDVVFTQDTFT